jgi:hypothetical protein
MQPTTELQNQQRSSMKVLSLLLAGALIAVVILKVYDTVFRDQGGPIFATASPKAMVDMVNSFAAGGKEAQVWIPSRDSQGSVLVDRAGMKGGTIINYTSPAFRRSAVDDVVVAYQFVTSHPHNDAAFRAEELRKEGYSVSVTDDPAPDIDKGKMSFVLVRGLLDGNQAIVYVFRRHKMLMSHGKPPSWSTRPSDLVYAK